MLSEQQKRELVKGLAELPTRIQEPKIKFSQKESKKKK